MERDTKPCRLTHLHEEGISSRQSAQSRNAARVSISHKSHATYLHHLIQHKPTHRRYRIEEMRVKGVEVVEQDREETFQSRGIDMSAKEEEKERQNEI